MAWEWLANSGAALTGAAVETGKWAVNADNLKAVGTIVGGAGQAYGAYKSGKLGEKALDLQIKDYEYAKKVEDQRRKGLSGLSLG